MATHNWTKIPPCEWTTFYAPEWTTQWINEAKIIHSEWTTFGLPELTTQWNLPYGTNTTPLTQSSETDSSVVSRATCVLLPSTLAYLGV